MALAGTLKDFGLPDIVQLIGLQRKSGTLYLNTDGEAVKVIFEGGNIVAAESSLTRPSDRIGNALVTQGAITQDQLNQALAVQKQTMQRLGHVLISEQIATEETLRKAVEAQLFQVVFRLFRWREGQYNFETQNTVDYERTGAVSLGADFVLMEGIRMVDEWPIIERRIPSMASVFKKVVDASQVQTKSSGDDSLNGLGGLLSDLGSGGSSKMSLSGDELLVFNAVDGRRTCQQLVEATPLHDFAVCRTLLDLMDRDMVVLTDVKGSATKTKSGGSGGAAGVAFMAVGVLVASFGVYRNLTTPFGVFGLPPLVLPAVDTAREARLLERLEVADARVRGFRLAYGRLPASMDELVSEGLTTRASIDGISLSVSSTGYRVEATGPAGLLHIDVVLRIQEAEAPAAPTPPTDPTPPPLPSPKR
ncbi:MAG: DUF4388 domain-containing protein [Vicinamibacteria bacterium]|nr:DUF4388 domain-containing protein [Vicinamibacteria bacterium]